MSTGPNNSFGSENRVSRYSKYRASTRRARWRTNADFAVPGGPTTSMCSPASNVTSSRRTSSDLSRKRASRTRPTSRSRCPRWSTSESIGPIRSLGTLSLTVMDCFPILYTAFTAAGPRAPTAANLARSSAADQCELLLTS